MKKIRQPKVQDFYQLFANSKKKSKILVKKSMGLPKVSKSLENPINFLLRLYRVKYLIKVGGGGGGGGVCFSLKKLIGAWV